MRNAVNKPDSHSSDRPPVALFVVLLLALCLRVVFLLSVKNAPLFQNPIIDAKEYVEWAQRILGGEILWPEVQLHGPLYPFFLAGVFRLFGPGALAPAIIQQLLGCVSCLLVYLIAARAFDRTVGVAACAAAGCSWMLMFYELNLLPVTLEILLNLCAIWLLARTQDRRSAGLLCLAGAALGLSALTRPTILLFILAWAAWLGIQGLRAGQRAAALVWPGVFLLSAVVPIAPVAARNLAVSGEFVLIQKNSGLNFYLGNGRDMNGFPSVPPGVDYDALLKAPERAGYVGLKAHDRYFYEKALQFAGSNPGAFALLQLKKVVLFFSSIEICPSSDIAYFREHSALPWRLCLPHGLVVPFALAWLFAPRRRDAAARAAGPRATAPLLVLLACVMAGCVLFTTCSRYRISSIPPFCILGAAGAVWLFRTLAKRDLRSAAPFLAALGVCALFVNIDWTGARATRLVRTEFQLGRIEANAGHPAQAVPHFEEQLRRTPNDPDVQRDLAIALMTMGQYARAEEHLLAATALRPEFTEAWESLGRAQLLAGRAQQSLAAFDRARRLDPRYWRAQAGMGLALMSLGRLDEAIEAYIQGLRTDPDNAAMHLELGSAYGAQGKLSLAEAHLERSVGLAPSNAEAQLRLAACYAAEGKTDLARRHAAAAKSLGSGAADELLRRLGARAD